MTLFDGGYFEQAISDFSKAIELDPSEADAHYNRGLAYGELHRVGEAIADFEKAIELDANHAHAYYRRGLALAEHRRIAEATADLETAQRLSHDADLIADIDGHLERLRGTSGHSLRRSI